MEDVSIVAETLVTTVGGITVGSGGSLNVASGSLKVSSGAASISGALTVGGATVLSGALTGPTSLAVGAPGATSVSVATASGTTVPIAQGIVRVSNTAASTSASCTLAAGTVDGQQVVVVNEAAANFVVTGNMKANQTVAPSSGALFVWVSADTQWWRCN